MGTGVIEKNNHSKRRHTFWVFFKAQLSAQFASFVDFLVTILLAKVFDLFYLYATFTGSIIGGMVKIGRASCRERV